ncbi:hypothetical protein E2562_005598 [Oryza meyeriana var. granulata]|uniref:Uncharacterized protein n=1 Tax=Oryza meyeriana var. granulata TaxID=110450 RepID=A0A6G1F416_9ORYZ|nr:hypothetical protein E2562_005598 [Oryza meyeriana var. granulata]
MAEAMPTTTSSLPGYEVSGGAEAAAARLHGSGSVGVFLGVLATVLVLTVVSCVVGRVCAARAEGPDERYDCAGLAGGRCWRWRWAARRPVRPAEEVKQPAALPLPGP